MSKKSEQKKQAAKEYNKVRDRLRRKIKTAKNYGIEGLPEMPSVPTKKTKKETKKLEKIEKNLLKGATYKTPEGKVLKGEKQIRHYQKQKGGKAAAEKKRVSGYKEEKLSGGIVVTVDPKTGEIISESVEGTTKGYEYADESSFDTGDNLDEIIDIEDNTGEEEEPIITYADTDENEEYLDELMQVLDTTLSYIDEIEWTEDDGVETDEEMADRKDILHRMLEDAIDEYGEAGVGMMLRDAAENGELNDLIDGAIRGSDDYSSYCFGELARIINGGALTAEQSAQLADVVNYMVGFGGTYV